MHHTVAVGFVQPEAVVNSAWERPLCASLFRPRPLVGVVLRSEPAGRKGPPSHPSPNAPRARNGERVARSSESHLGNDGVPQREGQNRGPRLKGHSREAQLGTNPRPAVREKTLTIILPLNKTFLPQFRRRLLRRRARALSAIARRCRPCGGRSRFSHQAQASGWPIGYQEIPAAAPTHRPSYDYHGSSPAAPSAGCGGCGCGGVDGGSEVPVGTPAARKGYGISRVFPPEIPGIPESP